LVEEGADVNLMTAHGMKAYDFALSFGHEQVARYLKPKLVARRSSTQLKS
jgi:ankyrin repeat protein